jgi:hypothetical protein
VKKVNRSKPAPAALALAFFILAAAMVAAAPHIEPYIVQCQGDCTAAAAAVRAIPGARVDHVFQNVAGMAVSLPPEAVSTLRARPDVGAVDPDVNLLASDPSDEQPLPPAEAAVVLTTAQIANLAQTLPASHDFNGGLTGAPAFHALGRFGAGVLVAVIDSGVANNSTVVPALAGSVIGGETFVPASDPVASATSIHNDPHGTFAAAMIAGHAAYQLAPGSPFLQSISQHSPASVVPCSRLGCAAGRSAVPMIGVAPAARIYAMKILPSNAPTAPSSRVIAAMDRAITLRRNFDNGVPAVPVNPGCGAEDDPCRYDSLPIQVVNMSFGGITLYAGALKDQLVAQILDAGMVPVIAAGGDGPAALTLNSPGTGRGALDVGAMTSAAHERVRLDVQLGLGQGLLRRPSPGLQVSTTSARGPVPDGRLGLDLVAEGYANFGQGADGHLSLVSGASFSAALTSGAATLLRERFPAASAAQIRGALADGANPLLLAGGAVDRGHGALGLVGASTLLALGLANPALPTGPATPSLVDNIAALGIEPIDFKGNRFSRHLITLLPGQVAHFYVPTQEDVDGLTVSVTGVAPWLPPGAQNPVDGDVVRLTVVDAPTSFAETRVSETVATGGTFAVAQPQSGLVRVAVQGASGNAGPVSFDLTIDRRRVSLGPTSATGTIAQNGDEPVAFDIPAGTGELSVLLTFQHNWGAYPSNDIDVVLETPSGDFLFDGASFASPERAKIANPQPGRWIAHVQGFTLNTASDGWSLWAWADGKRLKPAH